MNPTENPTPTPTPTPGPSAPIDPAHLQAALLICRSLRTQFLAVLLMLAVFTLSINVFLFKLKNMTHRQNDELVRSRNQLVADFKTNAEPRIEVFVSKMSEFAKTHPDYGALLSKYPFRISNAPSPARTVAPPPPAKGR